jgi:hypothetical protein
MKLSTAKDIYKRKSAQSYDMPDDETLGSFFLEALIHTASRCEPTALLHRVGDESGVEVLRLINEEYFIALPEKPDFGYPENNLNIDEQLSFAVINYACFLHTFQKGFEDICNKNILQYKINKNNAEVRL